MMSLVRSGPSTQPPGDASVTRYLARGAAADIWVVSGPEHLPKRVYKTLRVSPERLIRNQLDGGIGSQSSEDVWATFAEEFSAVVKTWSSLDHQNVVRVFGISDGMSLEVDYYGGGCVRDYLKARSLTIDKVTMISDVLAGIKYLHEHEPPIVHGNLNAGKLFVDHDGRAVVGEFGLAMMCYPFAAYAPSISFDGLTRWFSPELLDDDADQVPQPTLASDVWALGCTMYEILAEVLPYFEHKHEIKVQRVILAGEPPGRCDDKLKTSCYGFLWPVVQWCWALDPDNRPKVSTLIEEVSMRMSGNQSSWATQPPQPPWNTSWPLKAIPSSQLDASEHKPAVLVASPVRSVATTKAERRRTVMNTTDFDPSLLAESSSSTTLAPTPPPPSTLINTTPSKTAATSRPVAPRQSAQSVSSTSFNSPANQSSQKTLEQVLTMTSSPGDLQSALMALLEERNNLVQQNAQLWRIVEKQKASLATASKDLERIRAERERYRRLFEETTASGSGSERERRPTGSRSSTRVHPAVRVISQTHTLMSRHQSDNVAIGGLPTVAAVSPMNFDATFAQRMVLGPPPQPQPLANTNHAPLNPKTPTQSSVSGFQAPPLPPPFPNTYSRTSADTFIDTDDDYSAEGYSSTVYSPAESTSRQGVPMIIRNAPSIPSMNTLVNAGSIQTASLRSSTQADSPSLDSSPIATSPTSLTSTSPPLQPQGATQSQAQPPKMARTQSSQTAKTWPAPRLTQFDLTTAVISVPMSHIRANKRGNEVLSFVIGISLDPSVEREGWKIEKLYSDVLTLDVKVRQWLGRSALKKIARLPDAKIFEDSAPSKVDQRKAMLQAYLQSVLQAPWKNASDMVAFFTSDVISHDRTPVSHPGYKEGYLTKRGKNLGGWKTRYFVLQSPVLEYYESRGGAHLGSIALAGSRIGRQQLQASRDADDENAYRHAFLIIEGKRSPSIVPNRHVLCAESDEERDSWVEMLIRYVVGDHNKPSMETSRTQSRVSPQSRALISSFQEKPQRNRAMFQDEILEGAPLPISQVASDASNAKLFQSAPPPPGPSQQIPIENVAKQLMGYRQPAQEIPLSSSLPSHLDVAIAAAAPGQRSNSKLRHYPDMPVPRRANRASFHPSAAGAPSQFQRYQLAQPQLAPSPYKIKTIGPMDSVLFPSPGYYSSEEDPDANPAPIGNDRERKAKPGRFQGFGRTPGQKPLASTQPEAPVARAVFGIPLQESLTVAQIANLPAIVFRCIEYLEAKRADQEEGIYRLSGSSAVIKNLKDRFNTEGDVNLVESEEYWDSHVVAGLLKSYLRELPSSILTRDLHLLFLAVIGFADPQERVSQLASLISQLPLANYSLLRALTAHLVLIVQNSNVNKMTMRNVGIVFSPTLGIPAGVFSLMLNEFNRVFSFEAETTQLDATPPAATDLALAAPATDVAAGPSPMPKRTLPDPSRRNSRSYNDGHADKLLGLGGRTLKAAEESGEGEDVIEENGSDSEDETDYSVPLGTSPPETPGMAASSQHRLDPPSEPTPHKGHSATVAAARGLQVATSGQHQRSFSGRGQGSGGPGLPQSSRPAGGLSGSPTSRNTSPATPRI